MCGHVGAVGNINSNVEKAFKHLLIFDTVRGEDSTGVFNVKRGHNPGDNVLVKAVGDPFSLFDTRGWKSVGEGFSRVLMGHNRYATQGKVNRTNSHPFEFEKIVGAHNGTLTNKWALMDGHKFDVDSQALFNHIEHRGIDDALRIARGAWALVWWDKEQEEINFIRNKERTLYYCITKPSENSKDPVLFYASEEWMLQVALSRNGMNPGEVVMFEADVLHTIPVDKNGVLGKPHIRKVEVPIEEVKKHSTTLTVVGGTNTSSGTNSGNAKSAGVGAIKQGAKKASEVVGSINHKSIYDALFVGLRNCTMEAVAILAEPSTGAQYMACYSDAHPNYEIRVYRHTGADQLFNNVGCEFSGDISSFMQLTQKQGYYKVSPHSIKFLRHPVVDADGTILDEEDETITDHRGNEISSEDWHKKYGCCVFCCENIFPDDLKNEFSPAKYTKEGEILCCDCAADPQMTSYVSLV